MSRSAKNWLRLASRGRSHRPPGRGVLRGLAWLGGLAAAATLYAVLLEPRWLQVTRTRIYLRGLDPALEGLRIALLTDLHAGRGTPLSLIRRACRLAMREDPALVAITGDLADAAFDDFQPVLDELACLRPPLGVYAVPGNHDHHRGIELWHRQLRENPHLVDLTNRSLILEVDSARLCLAGVDDLAEGRPSLDSLPPPHTRDLTILLAHNPEQAERSRRTYDSVDLVLSGHTHGGQIRLPGIGPLRSSVTRPRLYQEGLRRRPWTQVYVSRGIGTVHLPARFLARPEVAILELTSAPRPPRGA